MGGESRDSDIEWHSFSQLQTWWDGPGDTLGYGFVIFISKRF